MAVCGLLRQGRGELYDSMIAKERGNIAGLLCAAADLIQLRVTSLSHLREKLVASHFYFTFHIAQCLRNAFL
jgi:hypothetical protein